MGDPQIDLDIETQFQGRHMQSNVTSLISNQIRKAIRRKHTLPNYKLRYKPFFHKIEDDSDVTDIILDGSLEVNISELSRLMIPTHINHVFCTLTLSPMPWILARQHDNKNLIVSLDLEIHKAKNQQIGIVFKQLDMCVMVEAIIPNTPATKAKIHRGDVLISIEGKKITHINSISKIIKSLNRPVFTLRIERIIPGVIKNDALLEDFDIYEDFNDFNITFSKNTDSVQIGTKLMRKNSIERPTSSDSSRSNTPTHTPRKQDDATPFVGRPKSKSLSRCNSESRASITVAAPPISDDNTSIKQINLSKAYKNNESRSKEDILETAASSLSTSINTDYYQQHSTIDCLVNSLIKMNDLAQFKLNENSSWFNLNVFGKCNDDIELLAFINIPVSNVLVECADSNLGQFVKQYSLSPPAAPNL